MDFQPFCFLLARSKSDSPHAPLVLFLGFFFSVMSQLLCGSSRAFFLCMRVFSLNSYIGISIFLEAGENMDAECMTYIASSATRIPFLKKKKYQQHTASL